MNSQSNSTPPGARAKAARGVDTDARPRAVSEILPVPTEGVRTTEDGLRERFLARRPVLDANGTIVGYSLELARPLAKSVQQPMLRAMDDEKLLIGVGSLHADKLLDGKKIFLSVVPSHLDAGILDGTPVENTVFCFSVRDWGTPAVISAVATRGLHVALDGTENAGGETLPLGGVDYVRVDVSRCDLTRYRTTMIEAQLTGKVVFLARNVAHEDLFDACEKLGFGLFEGSFFTRIQLGKPQRLDLARIHVLELMNLVAREAPVPDIERGFKDDPVLTYRLLRYINSPGVGLRHTVKSIAHALTLLGYKPLYRWLTLLLFSAGRPAPRDAALMTHALARARLMENLAAPRVQRFDAEGIFITGIFSLLDVLLNAPMIEVLHRVNLPSPVTEALLAGSGPYAPWLTLAKACEEGAADAIRQVSETFGLSPDEVNRAHLAAIEYAHAVQR